MNASTAPKNPRFIVIGAGITGLAAAHRLRELGQQRGRTIDVTVLEGSSRTGGVIQTIRRNGFLLEAGPDNFVTNKPAAVALCRRLDIEDQLQPTNQQHRRALVVRDGRLLPIPDGFLLMAPTQIRPILKSQVFSWRGKMRMALEPLIRTRKSDADESLASFVTRRLGREALDRLVQPLIGGIYSADAETLSLAATMPRFLELERKYGSVIRGMRRAAAPAPPSSSGARYGLFVSFRNGLDTLVNTLVDRIQSHHVHLNCQVTKLQWSQRGWRVEASHGQTFESDGILLATRAPQAAKILEPLDAQLAEQLSGIAYGTSAVIHAAYQRTQIPHPMDGFGFVVPKIENRSIIACSFSSVKYDHRAPDGFVLLRGFVGGATQPHITELDDDAMTAAVLEEFAGLLGVQGSPLFTTVHRYPAAMPQYHVGHLDRVQSIRQRATTYRGLELAGNAYEGVGIPDCIDSGEQAAQRLFEQLAE